MDSPPLSAALIAQLHALRGQADGRTVPSGVLAWWGGMPLPDGAAEAPPLSLAMWQACMSALRQAALSPELVPSLADVAAMTYDLRCDGPLPIAIASYQAATPTAAFRSKVMAAVQAGSALPDDPPPLADVLEATDVFCVGAPMHQQWAQVSPRFRSRVIRWMLDERFYFSDAMAARPDRIEFDPGDGDGWRRLAFGDTLVSTHPTGDSVTFAVRCHWGEVMRTARGTVDIGGAPAAPLPDETWPLRAMNGNSGTAWVFRAPGHDVVTNPVLVVEGFPGGYACDYLYDMWNQHGLMERLLAAGHDVILLAFGNGADLMERNAAVVVACLNAIAKLAVNPIATGGVSMGGLCTRYALAWLEQRGLPHHTHLYFSVDTPHRGSCTSPAVQWFTHCFRNASPLAADAAALLATPANREFLVDYVHGDQVGVSPLRTDFMAQLAALGDYPQHLRRVAVSSGRGDGGARLAPGTTLMTWTGSPFVRATLRSAPAGDAQVVAEGSCPLLPALDHTSLRMSSTVSWEGVPGGQASYTAGAGLIAQAVACGTVAVAEPMTCVVPTVSALDIAQDPLAPIPPPSAGQSPFHDYVCSETDQPHITLTAQTADWLFAQLTTVPHPAPVT